MSEQATKKVTREELEAAVKAPFMPDRMPIIWKAISESRGCTSEEAGQIYTGFCRGYSKLGMEGENSHDYLIRMILNS